MNAALKDRFVNADGKKYNIRYESCSVEALVKKGGKLCLLLPMRFVNVFANVSCLMRFAYMVC
jgi:hypothetical protein